MNPLLKERMKRLSFNCDQACLLTEILTMPTNTEKLKQDLAWYPIIDLDNQAGLHVDS